MSDLTNTWREEILKLANRYYDDGHKVEKRARELGHDVDAEAKVIELIARSDTYHQVYVDLCALVAKVDPRPGGPGAPARPW